MSECIENLYTTRTELLSIPKQNGHLAKGQTYNTSLGYPIMFFHDFVYTLPPLVNIEIVTPSSTLMIVTTACCSWLGSFLGQHPKKVSVHQVAAVSWHPCHPSSSPWAMAEVRPSRVLHLPFLWLLVDVVRFLFFFSLFSLFSLLVSFLFFLGFPCKPKWRYGMPC